MDACVRTGAALGVGGLGAAIGAAVSGAALPALVAGGCALGAGVAAVAVGGAAGRHAAALRQARREIVALGRRVAELGEAADAGREAIRVAGSFAELVATRNIELARQAGGDLLDTPTGLLDGRYFRAALARHVASARRLLHPVCLVVVDVERAAVDPGDADATLATFAGVLRRTLREADTACRTEELRVAMILEDTSERGGVRAAERIRSGFGEAGGDVGLLWAGIACYPSHALDADALVDQATHALEQARRAGRGRVEVAAGE